MDMLYMGVPVLEYLNLRGLDGYDNSQSLRDCNGDPAFSLRYLELVAGVSNYDQLKDKTEKLLDGQNSELFRSLKSKYNHYFKNEADSIGKITSEILKSIE